MTLSAEEVEVLARAKLRRLATFIKIWNLCTCRKADCPSCQPLIGRRGQPTNYIAGTPTVAPQG